MATYAPWIPSYSNQDLQLPVISAANMSNFVVVEQSSNGDTSEAVFAYAIGSYPGIRVTNRRVFDKKTDMWRNSTRLSTNVGMTDTLGETTPLPVEIVVAWNYHKDIDIAGMAALKTVFYAALGLFTQDLSGANGTPVGTILDTFNLGVTTKLDY